MTRSALLTGVTGFIGKNLARRLIAAGWAVHAVGRRSSSADQVPEGVTLHRLDGTVAGLVNVMNADKPDVVFHLASLYLAEHTPEQVADLIESNILLGTQLAEAMTQAGVLRLVNTGTAWQHFGTEAYKPVNLYAAAKQAFEDLLAYYHDARGLSVLSLKLFDTYGPGDPRRKLVQLLVDTAASGETLGMSPGEQVVDLTHVDDVVEAFILAGERLLDTSASVLESYFLSGERLTVKELVSAVQVVLGRSLDVEFGARPYRSREVMVPRHVGSSELLPGWDPRRRLLSELVSLRSPNLSQEGRPSA